MQARIRDVESSDVDECLNLLQCYRPFFGELMLKRGLIGLIERNWSRLLQHPAISHGLAEDLSYPRGTRTFTFGFTAFVREEWYRRYIANPTPICGEAALLEIDGRATNILLSAEDIKRQNGRGPGLLVLNLFCSCLPERTYKELDTLQAALEAYLYAIKGYRIAEVLMEAAGEDERAVFLGAGSTKVRRTFDLSGIDQSALLAGKPVLVGLTRAEANEACHKTAFSAQIFRHHNIRYGFSDSQQQVIRLAINHPSDAELVLALKKMGIELQSDALGRRWDRIFRRVEKLQPPDAPVIPLGTSSSAKRARVLMHFCREFHELRPHKYN